MLESLHSEFEKGKKLKDVSSVKEQKKVKNQPNSVLESQEIIDELDTSNETASSISSQASKHEQSNSQSTVEEIQPRQIRPDNMSQSSEMSKLSTQKSSKQIDNESSESMTSINSKLDEENTMSSSILDSLVSEFNPKKKSIEKSQSIEKEKKKQRNQPESIDNQQSEISELDSASVTESSQSQSKSKHEMADVLSSEDVSDLQVRRNVKPESSESSIADIKTQLVDESTSTMTETDEFSTLHSDAFGSNTESDIQSIVSRKEQKSKLAEKQKQIPEKVIRKQKLEDESISEIRTVDDTLSSQTQTVSSISESKSVHEQSNDESSTTNKVPREKSVQSESKSVSINSKFGRDSEEEEFFSEVSQTITINSEAPELVYSEVTMSDSKFDQYGREKALPVNKLNLLEKTAKRQKDSMRSVYEENYDMQYAPQDPESIFSEAVTAVTGDTETSVLSIRSKRKVKEHNVEYSSYSSESDSEIQIDSSKRTSQNFSFNLSESSEHTVDKSIDESEIEKQMKERKYNYWINQHEAPSLNEVHTFSDESAMSRNITEISDFTMSESAQSQSSLKTKHDSIQSELHTQVIPKENENEEEEEEGSISESQISLASKLDSNESSSSTSEMMSSIHSEQFYNKQKKQKDLDDKSTKSVKKNASESITKYQSLQEDLSTATETVDNDRESKSVHNMSNIESESTMDEIVPVYAAKKDSSTSSSLNNKLELQIKPRRELSKLSEYSSSNVSINSHLVSDNSSESVLSSLISTVEPLRHKKKRKVKTQNENHKVKGVPQSEDKTRTIDDSLDTETVSTTTISSSRSNHSAANSETSDSVTPLHKSRSIKEVSKSDEFGSLESKLDNPSSSISTSSMSESSSILLNSSRAPTSQSESSFMDSIVSEGNVKKRKRIKKKVNPEGHRNKGEPISATEDKQFVSELSSVSQTASSISQSKDNHSQANTMSSTSAAEETTSKKRRKVKRSVVSESTIGDLATDKQSNMRSSSTEDSENTFSINSRSSTNEDLSNDASTIDSIKSVSEHPKRKKVRKNKDHNEKINRIDKKEPVSVESSRQIFDSLQTVSKDASSMTESRDNHSQANSDSSDDEKITFKKRVVNPESSSSNSELNTQFNNSTTESSKSMKEDNSTTEISLHSKLSSDQIRDLDSESTIDTLVSDFHSKHQKPQQIQTDNNKQLKDKEIPVSENKSRQIIDSLDSQGNTQSEKSQSKSLHNQENSIEEEEIVPRQIKQNKANDSSSISELRSEIKQKQNFSLAADEKSNLSTISLNTHDDITDSRSSVDSALESLESSPDIHKTKRHLQSKADPNTFKDKDSPKSESKYRQIFDSEPTFDESGSNISRSKSKHSQANSIIEEDSIPQQRITRAV
ncbi:hypothetical protein TVAGG3_0964520, partial [Trichomonas vaginalis G3]